MVNIIPAQNAEHLAGARELMLEYAKWLEFDLCFQGFDEELQSLPGKYSPPQGRLLLAFVEGRLAGMGAFRPTANPEACEMKRLYVRPGFRGHALGRRIAENLIREAGVCGYERMRLDTVPGKMDSAIALYRELGFREIPPYYSTPVSGTLFMELLLPRGAHAG